MEINGYLDTTGGKKLSYERKDKESKKKYNENDIKIIKELACELKDHKQFSKIMILELKKKDINISSKILQKICNDEY